MDHLTKIIRNLSKSEARNYKLFANRIKHKGSQKPVQLFDYIKSGEFDEGDPELIKKLYGEDNRNAYYRLKNRLLEDIERSLLYLHFQLDEKVEIHNLISLAKIFSYKSQYPQAFHFLRKAERKAEKNEHFDLLNIVYDEIISLCRYYDEIDPETYIEKRGENREKYELITQANHVISVINYQLKGTNFSEKDVDVIKRLEEIKDDLDVASDVYQTPTVQLQVNECVRNLLLQQNDFESLETYLIDSLETFESEEIFSRSNHVHKIIILTWTIIALFRNKKIEKAYQYIEALHEAITAYDNLYYDKYVWAYYQSLAMYYNLTDQNPKAIELLEELKQADKYEGMKFYDIGLHINLALFYYCEGKLPEALDNLAHLSQKHIYDKLSDPWKLTLATIEMILHYENGDYEFVQHELKNTRRKFRELLKTEEHRKEQEFLKIFRKLLNNPHPFRDQKVQHQVEEFTDQYPEFSPGSNETINYTAWLKAKQENRSYYEVVLSSFQSSERV